MSLLGVKSCGKEANARKYRVALLSTGEVS
jgi:hypothetical protein